MDDVTNHKTSRKIVVGSAELGLKRDAMEIKPLFCDHGISMH